MPGFDGNHLEFHHSITQQSQWNVLMDGHVHVIINRTPGMKIDEKNEKKGGRWKIIRGEKEGLAIRTPSLVHQVMANKSLP